MELNSPTKLKTRSGSKLSIYFPHRFVKQTTDFQLYSYAVTTAHLAHKQKAFITLWFIKF